MDLSSGSEMVKTILSGGPILVAIVFMFMVWIKDRRVTAKDLEANQQTEKIEKIIETVKADTAWLKDIHDHKDQDGVPVWYVRQSLEIRIEKLTDAIELMTDAVMEMQNQSFQSAKLLEKLTDKIDTKS